MVFLGLQVLGDSCSGHAPSQAELAMGRQAWGLSSIAPLLGGIQNHLSRKCHLAVPSGFCEGSRMGQGPVGYQQVQPTWCCPQLKAINSGRGSTRMWQTKTPQQRASASPSPPSPWAFPLHSLRSALTGPSTAYVSSPRSPPLKQSHWEQIGLDNHII